MNRWDCPYCHESMYSSYDKREDEFVVCIHCDGTFKNPYYRQAIQDYKSFAQFQGDVIRQYFTLRKEG